MVTWKYKRGKGCNEFRGGKDSEKKREREKIINIVNTSNTGFTASKCEGLAMRLRWTERPSSAKCTSVDVPK